MCSMHRTTDEIKFQFIFIFVFIQPVFGLSACICLLSWLQTLPVFLDLDFCLLPWTLMFSIKLLSLKDFSLPGFWQTCRYRDRCCCGLKIDQSQERSCSQPFSLSLSLSLSRSTSLFQPLSCNDLSLSLSLVMTSVSSELKLLIN